jgi:hypothetical protein
MKIYRTAENPDVVDLFDPLEQDRVYDRNGDIRSHVQMAFELQDKIASESEVFNRVLQQEIDPDPRARFEQTDNPKAKTRNALISRQAYYNRDTKQFDNEAWEQDLLTRPFYGLA